MKTRAILNRCPFGVLLFAFGMAGPLAAQDQHPVSIEANVGAIEDEESRFDIVVDFEVQDGWHMYDHVPQGQPFAVTDVKLELPESVTTAGNWHRPVGTPYPKDPSIRVYEGKFQLKRQITARRNTDPITIGVIVSYQVCKGDMCLPPDDFKTTVSIPAAATADNSEQGDFFNKHFQAPQRLMVGELPLNSEAGQMYPSPAMFDVDNDGQIELVVGDIFGTLNIYENENRSGQGDPVWTSHTPLKTADGQPIKVSNW